MLPFAVESAIPVIDSSKDWSIGAILVVCLWMVLQYLAKRKPMMVAATGAVNGGNGKSGDRNTDWWTSKISDIVTDRIDDRVMPELRKMREDQIREHESQRRETQRIIELLVAKKV